MPFITPREAFDVRPLPATDLFILDAAVTYRSKRLDVQITVPAGFVTDLASVPWWGVWFMERTSKHIRMPAVLHDYALREGSGLDSSAADWLLYESMSDVINPAPKWKRLVVYAAVRVNSFCRWMKTAIL